MEGNKSEQQKTKVKKLKKSKNKVKSYKELTRERNCQFSFTMRNLTCEWKIKCNNVKANLFLILFIYKWETGRRKKKDEKRKKKAYK